MVTRKKDIDSLQVYLKILQLIPRKPRKISSSEIAQALQHSGLHLRDIQRKLKYLTENFDQLECDDSCKPYTYSWLEKAKGFNVSELNEQQSLVLRIAEQQLKYLLPATIIDGMKPFFQQAQQVLAGNNQQAKLGNQWLGKVCEAPTSLPLVPANIDEQVFNQVSIALFHNKWLKIQYQNQFGKCHNGSVMPLAIVQQGASIYLIVRYEHFSDERLLALHRIQQATVSTLSFERPKDFDLNKFQADGRLSFGKGEKIKLSFYIDRWAGFHLTETPLSQDQVILQQTEDYYYIQATVADSEMLNWWISKFGDEIWGVTKQKII
ncbi:helix-turn-helix transcriptional regulator [Volucribacter amazonae]|uniref:WYL domain-containing protein n=1 Tax=Volucribacter amazonae TaxID=256731 RepID=A0A9X4PFH0_9PAST|nr:WYL domain-containing protein [Volucribacter amazonae]MDG6894205.1 WYL domain-containing protein [Volucribacter amazonae]